MHVEAAQRLAAQARRAGVERLAHVSGIGSDANSPSLSASAAKASWQSGLSLPTPRSFAPQ